LFWNFFDRATLTRRNGEILLLLRPGFSTVSARFRGRLSYGKSPKNEKEGKQAAHDLDPHRPRWVIACLPWLANCTEKTMKAMSADRNMIKIAMSAPYLARDEERNLAVRWKDDKDQDARNQIALAHMRLVIAMASKFRGFGLPMSDLVQEGYVGLLEAAARFEPARDVRFSTYASWWIRASMQDYILRNWSIVRGGTSSAQKALFFNLRRLRAKLSRGDSNLTSRAIHEEIAVALGVSVADVQTMDARLSGNDASLQAPTIAGDADSGERLDLLPSAEPLPDEQVSGMIDGERRLNWLQGALTKLNDREKKIIRARRLTDDGATLEALGTELGISKERVRQIESRAIEKLRSALVSANPQMAAV
tara:strand:- start:2424 stop:3518 length:1095 start_codon:yes stop_codon:yes gene_type:complete